MTAAAEIVPADSVAVNREPFAAATCVVRVVDGAMSRIAGVYSVCPSVRLGCVSCCVNVRVCRAPCRVCVAA